MAQSIFHPSIEGAQHGAQPSNYMLEGGKLFKSAKEIRDAFESRKMTLDGVSGHCPVWVHTTAWTESPTIRPFIPKDIAKKSAGEIEKWAENYVLKLLDLLAELRVKVMPMFWGVAFGWELASGYPWGFWVGPGYGFV